jgi:CRP/FNR family transcriptional regulator, cyclic AMP receptor protein
LLLIKTGRIRLWKVTKEGNEITLDIRQAGDVFGESMFNSDACFPVNATCLEETYTCSITKKAFESLVLTNPNIGLQVIKNLSQRIDWLTTRVSDMSCSNLEERLYRVLVTVAQEHGKKNDKGITLPMPLTHEDLAFLVGAHRVSITRAMKELQNSGQIIRKGKYLIICPEAM